MAWRPEARGPGPGPGPGQADGRPCGWGGPQSPGGELHGRRVSVQTEGDRSTGHRKERRDQNRTQALLMASGGTGLGADLGPQQAPRSLPWEELGSVQGRGQMSRMELSAGFF